MISQTRGLGDYRVDSPVTTSKVTSVTPWLTETVLGAKVGRVGCSEMLGLAVGALLGRELGESVGDLEGRLVGSLVGVDDGAGEPRVEAGECVGRPEGAEAVRCRMMVLCTLRPQTLCG